jgi:ABC transport system ATP-binding/permease protein
MLAASATWFGALNAAKEIVKERPVLRRERLAGLRVAPYLSSKIVVLALLCLVQTTALLSIIWLKVSLPSSGVIMWGPLELWITLVLAAFAALALGLVISASMTNADRATSLVPILLIPQLIFVGGPGSGTAARWLSYVMITHWSVEAMKVTVGIPYNTSATGFGATDLLIRWAALLVMSTVFIGVAAWQLARSRAA